MKNKLFMLVFSLFCFTQSSALFSQMPSASVGTMQNRPFLNWQTIETEHFTVIYPAGIEKDAQRTANTLEKVYPHVHKTIKAPKRKTPILLFTGYPESNGMATYAPRRSEWYNTPPQTGFGGVIDWYQTLGLHEYRHILQFDSMNTGFFGASRFVFGEEITMLLVGISIPGWYFEGDAVVTETLLSNAGRGRTPAFDAELRALLLNGRRYGFYKADLGSYADKDPLESPYLMGYFLASRMRRQYGPDILNDVTYRTSLLPLPYMHTLVTLGATSKWTSDIYEDAMDEMTALWNKQLEGLAFTGGESRTDLSKWNWTNNRNPQYLPDGSLSVLTWDFGRMPRIASISSRSSYKTIENTFPSDDLFSAAAGRIVWAEAQPDIRWGLAGSSEIYLHDISAKKTRRLTAGARYYAPSLSADGKTIAAVEYGTDNICSIVLLDAATGREIKKIPSENNAFIQTPHFTPDGKNIIFCAVDAGKGKALLLYSTADGSVKPLTAWGYENILNPVSDGKHVFYSSEYSGIDNIYALEISSGKKFQVTSRRFGAYSPALSADGTRLAFSDLDADGYRIMEIAVTPDQWTPIEKVEVRRVNYSEPLLSQEENGSVLNDIPQKKYASKDYTSLSRVINVHSWYPGVDLTSKNASLQLNSKNLLGSFQTIGTYAYNWNEKTHTGTGTLSYGGFFPVFDLSGRYGNRYVVYTFEDALDNNKEKTEVNTWKEKSIEAGMTLPFNFSRGLWLRTASFGVNGAFTRITDMKYPSQYRIEPDDKLLGQDDGDLIPVTANARFINALQWRGDIVPRWGQLLTMDYTRALRWSDYRAEKYSGRLMLYFPGLNLDNMPYIPWVFRNQGLYFEAAAEYQLRNTSTGKKLYRYESSMLFPRGYDAVFVPALAKGSVNYVMPLLCPDLNMMYLFYLKRIYINGFFDFGAGAATPDALKKRRDISYYRSAGFELMADIRPLNKPLPLQIGYRFSYMFDGKMKTNQALAIAIGSPI